MKTQIKISDLNGQTIGFDAFNQLFQFLSSIRDQSTGSTLTDSEGNTTSHLIGIINRVSNMLQNNIHPVWVFDGENSPLKMAEQEKRRETRKIAETEYEKAMKEGNIDRAKMFARRMNRLTDNMVDDAKELLNLMGVPIVQAPGEGEGQSSQMNIEGLINGTASQDYDTLMFGSPVLIRNLNIHGRRNLPNGRTKLVYPEKYELNKVLSALSLTHEQFVDMGILMGTDFNPGFEKVGPKTAYKFIQKYGSFEKVAQNEDKVAGVDLPYETIRDIFLKPDVTKNISLPTDLSFDYDSIMKFIKDRNFSSDRYINILKKTQKQLKVNETQTSLSDWF